MLAVGVDLDAPVPVLDGLLKVCLQVPGVHADALNDPGRTIVGLYSMEMLLFPVSYRTWLILSRSAAAPSAIPMASDIPIGSDVERPSGATIFLSS